MSGLNRLALGVIIGALSIIWSGPAQAQTLQELLAKGTVVVVETNKKGRFHSATAVAHVKASAEDTWRNAIDFGKYKEYMPNLVLSDTKKTGENVYAVTFEVEVPGINPEYTFEYTLKPDKHRMTAKWKDGDLKGSFVKWRIRSTGASECMIYYTTATRNFSGLAESLEDDQQTVTIGVNVAAALATVKAMKLRTEGKK